MEAKKGGEGDEARDDADLGRARGTMQDLSLSTASGSRDLPRTGRDAPALVNINRGMLQRFPLLQNFAIPVCHTGGAHGDRGRAWGRLGDRRAGQAPRAQRRPACARALT